MKKFEVKVEIRVELTQQDIDDIMVAALEGGINYWCDEAAVEGGEYLGKYASDPDLQRRYASAPRHG